MKDEKKKAIVKKILLTNIIVKKKSVIKYEKGSIISSQKYNRKNDPDMSDFSIGFYEIIYSDFLKNTKILKDISFLKINNILNFSFAGDTINSYVSISKRKPNIPLLKKYHGQYHCLANFWLIPFVHGRKSAKLSRYDSLDMYLYRISDDKINKVYKFYPDFFSSLDDNEFNLKKFKEVHFMKDYKLLERIDVINKYNLKNPDGDFLINNALDFINNRADEIVAQHCDKLYDYFEKLDLINNPEFF